MSRNSIHKIDNVDPNYEYEFPEATPKPLYEESNWVGAGNWVQRADGKTLFVYTMQIPWTDTYEIYFAVTDSDLDMFNTSNLIPSLPETSKWKLDNVLIYPGDIASTARLHYHAGELFLYVFDAGDRVTIPSTFRIYKSANGLGTDFTLYKEVFSSVIGGGAGLGIGEPCDLSSGRIVMFTKMIDGATSIIYRVYRTDDNWQTYSYTSLSPSSYAYVDNGYKTIAKTADESYLYLMLHTHAPTNLQLFYSTDKGVTWTNAGKSASILGTDCYMTSLGDGYIYLYLSAVIYRRPDNVPIPIGVVDSYSTGPSSTWGEPWWADAWVGDSNTFVKMVSNKYLCFTAGGDDGWLYRLVGVANTGKRIRNLRRMYGSNAQNIQWEPTPGVYNPNATSDCYHPSMVVMPDGRVLYMYSRGDTVYQAFIPDIATFYSQGSTVTNEQVVLSGLAHPRASVFNSPNGDLFFLVTYGYTIAGDLTAKLLLYKSDLKDGSDWRLYSTIFSLSGWPMDSYSPECNGTPVGVPTFVGSRWVLAATTYYILFGEIPEPKGTILTSEDNGLTWTIRANYLHGPGCFSNISRNIAQFDGALWCAWYGFYAGGDNYVIKSTDGGLSWSTVYSVASDIPRLCYTMYSDHDYLYLLTPHDDDYMEVFAANKSPTQRSDFVLVQTVTTVHNGAYNPNVLVYPYGDKVVILMGAESSVSYNYNRIFCANLIPAGERIKSAKYLLNSTWGGISL